jgi:hypothetical protein
MNMPMRFIEDTLLFFRTSAHWHMSWSKRGAFRNMLTMSVALLTFQYTRFLPNDSAWVEHGGEDLDLDGNKSVRQVNDVMFRQPAEGETLAKGRLWTLRLARRVSDSYL